MSFLVVKQLIFNTVQHFVKKSGRMLKLTQDLRATGIIWKHIVTCNVYYVKLCAMLD
jgi:hypothetical protein